MYIDDLQFHVFFGDEGFYWDDNLGGGFLKATILRKRSYAVPALVLELEDRLGLVGNNVTLTEGMLVRIQYAKGSGSPLRDETYRLGKIEREKVDHSTKFTLLCWYDAPKWFIDSNTSGYRGTSAEAIQKIAEECGLKYEGDTTNDKQAWLGFGDKNYVFARKIASRGWVDDKSLMQLIYEPGRLIYRNIEDHLNQPIKAKFSYDAKIGSVDNFNGNAIRSHIITSDAVLGRNGILNLNGGYKQMLIEQDSVKANGEQSIYKQVAIRTGNNAQVQLNGDISEKLENGRIKPSIIKTENTHEKYNQAYHQNSRGFQLLGQGIVITTPLETDLQLLDTVEINVSGISVGGLSPDRDNNKLYDGNYMVDSIITQIGQNSHAQLIIGVREGLGTT